VLFQFSVLAGQLGEISEIYFQDGALVGGALTSTSNLVVTDGMLFSSSNVSPGEPPGGKGNDPALNGTPFISSSTFFAATGTTGSTGSGTISSGESLGVLFQLGSGKTYDDVVAALIQGASLAVTSGQGNGQTVNMNGGLRIAFHARDLTGGKSDTFVTTPYEVTAVPEPSSLTFAFAGVATWGLCSLVRRRYRNRPSSN
jgi:hypothetical protein